MMKQKMTYMQKVRMALFFGLGQVITLLIIGGGVTTLIAPIFIKDTTLRVVLALAGGVLALLIGLPLACTRRLQAIDADFGEGVADEVVKWYLTAQKDDVLDLEALAENVRAEKQQKVD